MPKVNGKVSKRFDSQFMRNLRKKFTRFYVKGSNFLFKICNLKSFKKYVDGNLKCEPRTAWLVKNSLIYNSVLYHNKISVNEKKHHFIIFWWIFFLLILLYFDADANQFFMFSRHISVVISVKITTAINFWVFCNNLH